MTPLRGRILVYCTAVSAGLLRGEDGVQYPFSQKAWKAKISPAKGEIVSFNLAGVEAVNVRPSE